MIFCLIWRESSSLVFSSPMLFRISHVDAWRTCAKPNYLQSEPLEFWSISAGSETQRSKLSLSLSLYDFSRNGEHKFSNANIIEIRLPYSVISRKNEEDSVFDHLGQSLQFSQAFELFQHSLSFDRTNWTLKSRAQPFQLWSDINNANHPTWSL